MRRTCTALLVATPLAIATIASTAVAQTTTTVTPPTVTTPTVTTPTEKTTSTVTTPADESTPPLAILPEDHLIDRRMARSWSVAPARTFIATTVDIGWVYARPRVSLGYGKPFTSWVGVDVNPVASSSHIGVYGGARLSLPFVDLRVGSRYVYSFLHSYYAPTTTFNRVDLDADSGSPAKLLTHEAELTVNIPAGPGDILLLGSASIVTGVPEGQFAFEETLRVIVTGPYIWRARTGYSVRFGSNRQHSVGFVGEVLDVPRRGDALTVRVGPVLRIVLSRRVEVRGSFVTTVFSPDRIGLIGGDFTELGVRYRWASE